MKNITLFLFILMTASVFSQNEYKPFQGKLVYTIDIVDTAFQKMFPTKLMTIYTNDTIVRIENESDQLGKQVVIKHTVLNKSILMLQAKNNYYAIQTDLNKVKVDSIDSNRTNRNNELSYHKKWGKKHIANMKANRMKVTNNKTKQTIEVLYLKNYSPKYIDAYNDLPGLAVKYYITTPDGTYVYTLISMEYSVLNNDLFGVPSNYKRVSFSQFLDEIIGTN
ncbi:MAG: hypothetical protein HYR91_08995 [Flavobacteriia bacterium]|nr:hypothetical protein [Flavobacteriia bacterium]